MQLYFCRQRFGQPCVVIVVYLATLMQVVRGAYRQVVPEEEAQVWESEAPMPSSPKRCPRRSTANSEVSIDVQESYDDCFAVRS